MRRKYDLNGLEGLEEVDLSKVEIDISSLGTMGNVVASLFSQLGVLNVKSRVSQSVLDSAGSRDLKTTELKFNDPISSTVRKNSAHFYKVQVTREDVESGFCVFCKSPSSRFKVLLFHKGESRGEEVSDIKIQEDSTLLGKQGNVAGIFFFDFPTYSLGQPPSTIATAKDPEAALFRRLETLEPRDTCSIQPGEHVFAVYGDNFLKSSTYTIELLRQADYKDEAMKIKVLEEELVKRRQIVCEFEQQYRQAQQQYQLALQRYEAESKHLDKVLGAREKQYGALTSKKEPKTDQGGGLRSLFGFRG